MRALLIVLLLSVSAQAQDFKFLPWKYDKWNSTDGSILRHDKLEHVIRDGALFWGLGKLGVPAEWRFVATTSFAVAWEIRDGFAWRKTDGYSHKDLLAGVAGQVVVFGAEKIFTRKKNSDKALRQEVFFMADSVPATFSQRKLR